MISPNSNWSVGEITDLNKFFLMKSNKTESISVRESAYKSPSYSEIIQASIDAGKIPTFEQKMRIMGVKIIMPNMTKPKTERINQFIHYGINKVINND